MPRIVCSISEAVERVSRHYPKLNQIYVTGKQHTDEELAELVDCLVVHPDLVTHLFLGCNRLTDETGVKLARYVAASSTVEYLGLSRNQLGSATYLALAAALCINTSLEHLYLYGNQSISIDDKSRIEEAFVSALRVNHSRPIESSWWLYTGSNDFSRLRDAAEELGHPTMQALLATTI